MPALPHSIELHDSLIVAAEGVGDELRIKLRPEYVHQGGKGWRQDADLIVTGAIVQFGSADLPCRISDGTLKTAQDPYHNLLSLPLSELGTVNLWLELEDGTEVTAQGTSARIKLPGEAAFVESFS